MATKYFCTDANDGICDQAGATNGDLSKTQGSTATLAGTSTQNDSSFDALLQFGINVSADTPITGVYDTSYDVASASPASEFQHQMQLAQTQTCSQNSTREGSTNTGTGIFTDNIASWTWSGTSVRLSMRGRGQRIGGSHGNKTMTWNVNDADSFVNAPWTAGGGDPDILFQRKRTNILLRM